MRIVCQRTQSMNSQSQDYCIPINPPFKKKSNLINKHEHIDLLLRLNFFYRRSSTPNNFL